MLKARERETPRKIQHQSVTDEQSAARLFPGDRRQPMCTTAALVATALFVLMLVGPNVLTEKEIRARMTSPPRRSCATPGSLPELTDLDYLPWTHAQSLSGLDELSQYHVLRLPKTSEPLARNGSVGSPTPQRHASPVAA
ncbi:hypothetical protein Amsp01_088300 [Amycolatopsis sp. NBRC 101858]|uniref:hypothetical protein n=1 Tax=Amycolatopsis sp. NBRC 101858 TaxID=3032200 RepID=UPI0024A3DABE|nr:hypothetical protein [Amycolatopsis sp. NBRC 101858]GLY42807.1 hypothetical protein Amsp01_088300 [Amycolatopsis sp. NBRC 101858]